MPRLLVLAALLFALPAGATLEGGDLFEDGDGLITRDFVTGLDWLDLTATQNLSYNSIAAGDGGWTTVHGFRYATGAELAAFWNIPPAGFKAVYYANNEAPALMAGLT